MVEIEHHLRTVDPRLGALIDQVIAAAGVQRFEPSPAATHFEALARSIVFQQLSGKAARTIHGRVVDALGGAISPEAVLRSSPEALRAAGLSQGKARYLTALSEAVASGSLALEGIEALPDEAVIDALTQVKGIGVWTAQMFLMFRLGRGDVLPTNDLGIQKGLQRAHGLRKPAAPGYVRKAGVRWAPHRSTACLYLWAALDQLLPTP